MAQHWTEAMPSVRAFLFATVHDPAAVDDLLQDVALTALQKLAEFTRGTDFLAWTIAIARFKVMGYQRRLGDNRRQVGDAVLASLADAAIGVAHEGGRRHEALRHCIEGLPERQRRVLTMRYEQERPIEEIATHESATPNSITVFLHRIRIGLRLCIEQRLSEVRA